MKDTILITGASGMIGQQLQKRLNTSYNVRVLARKPEGPNQYYWNVEEKTIDSKALLGVDHIIHLAGANIFEKRWTQKRKKEIIDSRIESAQLLLNELKKNDHKLKSFVSASAVGYYGAVTTQKIFKEDDPKGNDFLSEVVGLWENAADEFTKLNIAEKVVKIRTAVVFDKEKSALQKIENPIKNNIGAALGTGNQYMPWIHVEDLCAIYERSISDDNMLGVYNAAASQHLTNQQLTKIIAEKCHKKLWLPNIPSFILRIALGEASCMILEGSRVSNKKLLDLGFHFKHDDLDSFL